MSLCVDVEAVVESLKTETGNSAIFIYSVLSLDANHEKHIASFSAMSNPKLQNNLSEMLEEASKEFCYSSKETEKCNLTSNRNQSCRGT